MVMRTTSITLVLLLGCTGGEHYTNFDGGDGDDAASIDADPNAPDASPDADTTPPTLYRLVADDRQAGDNFGYVAISGDTVAIGAPGDDDSAMNSGAVYIFEWNDAIEQWEQAAKLKAADPLAEARFGSAVDLEGDTLAVGAHGVATSAGVYVFEQSGTTWIQTPKLTSGVNYDSFGSSVALDGTVLVVGAPDDDEVDIGAGAVHVFNRGASNWTYDEKLTVSGSAQFDRVGHSVAIKAGRLAAGATGVDISGFSTGAVDIWEAAGATYLIKPRIASAVTTSGLLYGNSVSLDGDYLAVGVPKADRVGMTTGDDTGAVSIYQRNVGTAAWEHSQTITASDESMDAQFGNSVGLDGTVIVAGAYGAASGAGAGYRFDRVTTWSETDIVTSTDAMANDNFGGPVDIDGQRFAFGSIFDDSATGAAYILMP